MVLTLWSEPFLRDNKFVIDIIIKIIPIIVSVMN